MVSPTEKDVKRVTDILRSSYGGSIRDRETFNRVYDDYMQSNLPRQSVPGDNFANDVFSRIVDLSGGRVTEKLEPHPQERLADIQPEKAEKYDYGKADKVPKEIKGVTRYKYAGKQKQKIVYARRIYIKTKYGRQIRYIDNRGRYVGAGSYKGGKK
jgi:hypothetical protein